MFAEPKTGLTSKRKETPQTKREGGPKGAGTSPAPARVLEREKAVIGLFVTLQPPTRDMLKGAVSAGFYQSHWGSFPRLQILTVADLLDGSATALYPRMNAATFKRAARQRRTQGEQTGLF